MIGELLPVETLQPGDELVLPLDRVVLVERLDRYDDDIVVRWHAGPYYREPHALAGQREQLGSLKPHRPGDLVLGRRNRDPEPKLA